MVAAYEGYGTDSFQEDIDLLLQEDANIAKIIPFYNMDNELLRQFMSEEILVQFQQTSTDMLQEQILFNFFSNNVEDPEALLSDPKALDFLLIQALGEGVFNLPFAEAGPEQPVVDNWMTTITDSQLAEGPYPSEGAVPHLFQIAEENIQKLIDIDTQVSDVEVQVDDTETQVETVKQKQEETVSTHEIDLSGVTERLDNLDNIIIPSLQRQLNGIKHQIARLTDPHLAQHRQGNHVPTEY